MKKLRRLLAILITCVLAGSLAACGNAGSSTEKETSADNSGDRDSEGSHILVVYFSRTGEQYTVGVIDHGNTAIVAEMIADETGAGMTRFSSALRYGGVTGR